MIGLLQRVSKASVTVKNQQIGAIGPGLLVLIGVEKGDSRAQAERLLQRLLGYRVFEDDHGKMNLSVMERQGGLLLVPQFTLAADTNKGLRASFTSAAEPAVGEELYNYLVCMAGDLHPDVHTGQFGADMQVALVNDGPVTFWLQSRPATVTATTSCA
ncbi:MAG: D-aminoacyl-tRNA deacylase [Gammaproteobacteria bacterium]|nr:MAG: D-aminoacyl-tRNA deacylase [Gammaproteobacteria bacterium]